MSEYQMTDRDRVGTDPQEPRSAEPLSAGEWLLEHPDAPLDQQWCWGCGAQMHVGEPHHKVYWPGHSEYREPLAATRETPAGLDVADAIRQHTAGAGADLETIDALHDRSSEEPPIERLRGHLRAIDAIADRLAATRPTATEGSEE